MTQIHLDIQEDKYLISLDKKTFDRTWIVRFLEKIRVEELSKQLDLGDEIDALGETIKEEWWAKNKSRFIHE
jgi:hypothetical protein